MKYIFVLLVALLAAAQAVEVSVDYDLLEGENVASPIPEPLEDELFQVSLDDMNDESEVVEDNWCPPKKYDESTNPDHLDAESMGEYDPDELGDAHALGANDVDVLFSTNALRDEDTDEAVLAAEDSVRSSYFDAAIHKAANVDSENALSHHDDADEHFKNSQASYVAADLHDADKAMLDSDHQVEDDELAHAFNDAEKNSVRAGFVDAEETARANAEGEMEAASELADQDILLSAEELDLDNLSDDDAGDEDDEEEDTDEDNHFEQWDSPEEEDEDEDEIDAEED